MRKKTIFAFLLISLFGFGCVSLKSKPVPVEERREIPEHQPIYNYDGWVIARGSMHNHTIFSDGCRTPDDLVLQARNEGIAILAITDHREGRLCLGKREKFCLNMGGVESKKTGYDKYLSELKRLARESQMPIIIPGLEVVPHIWNERDFPKMFVKGDSWHFTVYGIEDPEVFKNMPARSMVKLKVEKPLYFKPYNDFVNYIVEKGGIVFQAHPEWINYSDYVLLELMSEAPLTLSAQIPKLTGVAIIPEGFYVAGEPGGVFDQGLMEYLAGYRDAPLWTWGEADFHCPPQTLRIGTTLFYLKYFSKEEYFNAVHSGRMVALMGELFQDVYVSEFSAGDGKKLAKKIMLGETVELSGPPVIRFSLSKDVSLEEARLIRNGKVIYKTKSSSFEYKDDEASRLRIPCYYRVQLIGGGSELPGEANRLYTNPIFVRWR